MLSALRPLIHLAVAGLVATGIAGAAQVVSSPPDADSDSAAPAKPKPAAKPAPGTGTPAALPTPAPREAVAPPVESDGTRHTAIADGKHLQPRGGDSGLANPDPEVARLLAQGKTANLPKVDVPRDLYGNPLTDKPAADKGASAPAKTKPVPDQTKAP